MNRILNHILKRFVRICYLVGSACLLAGLLMPFFPTQVNAGGLNLENTSGEMILEEGQACVPPADWDATVRLFGRERPSKTWDFEVADPLMDVVLEFFYYQDYDHFGCPFDCSAGVCQEAEIGSGQTPLGSFEINDGSLGAHDGKVRLSGRLTQGSYQASFWVTGSGSINVGLRVMTTPVVTDTPQATPTASDEPASTPTATDTAVNTPTATVTTTVITPTATETPLVFPPVETVTPTNPAETPSKPTSTPASKVTPTPTEVSTLPPPVSPPGVVKTPVVIPITGADLRPINHTSAYSGLLRSFGLGLLGLGLLLHGIGLRRSG